jgi:hypothetical protein
VSAPEALNSLKALGEATRNALVAVKHVAIVNEGSHDSPLQVDAKAPGALAGACALQEVRHLLPSKTAID